MQVVLLDYGAGNTYSVQKAFERMGITVQLTADKATIEAASHVIFPGVGHAKAAMEQLRASGLDLLIPTLKQPVIGVCLGMQLLCGLNEESNESGLGIFDVAVRKFSDAVIVPHMGWNEVHFPTDSKLSEAYYFVHSYRVPLCEDTWGICGYEAPFSAALRKDNFFGVQFHPEKSGEAGQLLLEQFIQQSWK